MKKYSFQMPQIAIFARSLEEALGQVADHIATAARHVGNDRPLEDCKPAFSISESEPTADELKNREDRIGIDHAAAKHGAIPLNLDPESERGRQHAEQQDDRRKASEAEAAAKAKDSRTDAENLTLHSAKEQAR